MRLLWKHLACTSAVFAAAMLAALALPAQAARRDPAPVALPAPLGVVRAAMSLKGVPYLRGGDDRQGLDCSGLVYRVFRDITGQELPRSVESLFCDGAAVTSQLHIGDLLFFDTRENRAPAVATHVGVYAGGDRFVHAASEGTKTGVIVSTLQAAYYRDKYLGARRLIQWRAPVLPVTLADDYRLIVETDPFPSREALTIRVYNGMSGGGPVDLSVLKGDAVVLSRRIVPGAAKPSEVTIQPDTGQWTVRVARIFKGRELQRVSFTVEE
jgi:hypothetical protein